MAKGLILVDDIPCNCFECGNHNYHFCSWTGDCIEEYMNDEYRPNSCPIKPVPEKEEMTYENDEYDDGYVFGWNQCLEKILRK